MLWKLFIFIELEPFSYYFVINKALNLRNVKYKNTKKRRLFFGRQNIQFHTHMIIFLQMGKIFGFISVYPSVIYQRWEPQHAIQAQINSRQQQQVYQDAEYLLWHELGESIRHIKEIRYVKALLRLREVNNKCQEDLEFWQRVYIISHSNAEKESGIWNMRNPKTWITTWFNKYRDVYNPKYTRMFNHVHCIKAILTGTHATAATYIKQGMLK